METLQWLLGEITAMLTSAKGAIMLYGALFAVLGLLVGLGLVFVAGRRRMFNRSHPVWTTLAKAYYALIPLSLMLLGGAWGSTYGAHSAAGDFVDRNAKQLSQYAQEYFPHFQTEIAKASLDQYRGLSLDEIIAAQLGGEYGVVPGTWSHKAISGLSAATIHHVLHWADISYATRDPLAVLGDLQKVRTRPNTFIGLKRSIDGYVDDWFGNYYLLAFWWFLPFLLLFVLESGLHWFAGRSRREPGTPAMAPVVSYSPLRDRAARTESPPFSPVEEPPNNTQQWSVPDEQPTVLAPETSQSWAPAPEPPPISEENPAPAPEITARWGMAPEAPAVPPPPPISEENPAPAPEIAARWGMAPEMPAVPPPPISEENPLPAPEIAAQWGLAPEVPAPPPVFDESQTAEPAPPWIVAPETPAAEVPATQSPPPVFFDESQTAVSEENTPLWGAALPPPPDLVAEAPLVPEIKAQPPPPPPDLVAEAPPVPEVKAQPPPPPDDAPASKPSIKLPPSLTGATTHAGWPQATPQATPAFPPHSSPAQNTFSTMENTTISNPPGVQHFAPSRTPTPYAVTYILGGSLLQMFSSSLASGWSANFVAIFGFIIFYVGLDRLRQGLDPVGQSAAGLLKVAALIGAGAGVIDLIPLLGWLATLGYVAAFVIEIVGYLKLQGSHALNAAGKSGATLLLLAMIVAIAASILSMLPFGGFLAAPLMMATLALIFFGWVKVQEGMLV